MSKVKSIELHGAAYDAAAVAEHKTFESFKAEADEQTKSNETAHWGQWPADKREENLRAIYDQAVEAVRPAKVAAPVKTDDGDGKPGDSGKAGTTKTAESKGDGK